MDLVASAPRLKRGSIVEIKPEGHVLDANQIDEIVDVRNEIGQIGALIRPSWIRNKRR